jgi:hypothetical protein
MLRSWRWTSVERVVQGGRKNRMHFLCRSPNRDRAQERKDDRCLRLKQVEVFGQEFARHLWGNGPNPGGLAPGKTRNTIRQNDEERKCAKPGQQAPPARKAEPTSRRMCTRRHLNQPIGNYPFAQYTPAGSTGYATSLQALILRSIGPPLALEREDLCRDSYCRP